VKRSRKAQSFARELDLMRPLLMERSDGLCEYCYDAPVEVIHHRLRRSQGGTNHLKNLLAVCSDCHNDIHGNPKRSYATGALLPMKGIR